MSRIRLTQEEFLSRVKQIWGDRFDFSKAIFKDTRTKVEDVLNREFDINNKKVV